MLQSYQQEVLCICRCRVLWIHSILLSTRSNYCIGFYPSFIVYSVICTCSYSWCLLASVTDRHYKTTCIKASLGFQIRLHSLAKNFCFWISSGQLLSSGCPSPQPSTPPSDLDVPIVFWKGKRSCTDHLIFHFIFYDRPNPSFRQFALSLSSVSISRSYEKAILVSAWKQAMD